MAVQGWWWVSKKREKEIGREAEIRMKQSVVNFRSKCSLIFLLPQYVTDGVHLCKMFIIEGAKFGTSKQSK